jgi:hypothetical protein
MFLLWDTRLQNTVADICLGISHQNGRQQWCVLHQTKSHNRVSVDRHQVRKHLVFLLIILMGVIFPLCSLFSLVLWQNFISSKNYSLKINLYRRDVKTLNTLVQICISNTEEMYNFSVCFEPLFELQHNCSMNRYNDGN